MTARTPTIPRRSFVLLLLCLNGFLLRATPSPQTNLPEVHLTLGGHSLNAKIAADDSTRERGLMSRTNLSENEAMLFVFPGPRPVSFWMKDTPVPLSIAYMGSSGRILEIHDLKPFDETPVPSASASVDFALEVPRGWFSGHGILPGDMVGGLPSPTLAK